MVGESQFIDAVARRTGLSWLGAVRATHSVLRSLAERLTPEQAQLVAARLSPELGAVVLGGTHGESFDLHELVRRVETRTGAHRERALEYIAVVGMTLGEALGDDALAPVRLALPPAIGFLLRSPPEEPEERRDDDDLIGGLFLSAAHQGH
jgi:uncharacterized protein (DUF2267 family)